MRSLIVVFSLVVVALSALAVEQAAAEEAAADVEPVATSAPMAGTAPTAEGFDRHRMAVMFGGGYSSVSIGEEGVFSETSSTPDDFTMGMAAAIEYAYRIDRQLSVDGFATMWMGTLDGDLGNEDWVVSVIGGGFRWRPTGEGFYLRGGFGASIVTSSLVDPQSDEYESEYMDLGFGAAASLGYDVRIARTFAAGPRLETLFVDVGDGVTALATSLMFTFTF